MPRPPQCEPSVHWRGHVFRFGAKSLPTHDPSAGLRLLLIAFVLEAVIGPRLWLFGLLGLPLPPSWLRVPLQLGAALMLVPLFAGLSLSRIGLYRWREWSSTEKSYFVQTFFIANVVFSILFVDRLRSILAEPALWGRAVPVLATSFLWGFYQEVVYRGILQTELVRRMGALRGILLANVLFAFGPLHFYHFYQPAPVLMFAGIFAIGLFFAVLFQRSGNLWMVGVFHGLGESYILGTLKQ
jgi:membrane protease YdiL (CAAX protease family)